MIINGNYKHINLDDLKPQFIEIFTKFYGEKYRNRITDVIYRTEYYPFHELTYIDDYYSEYIKKFREEILENFYQTTGFERTAERDNLIWKPKQYLTETILNNACQGAKNIDQDNSFTEEGKELIIKYRKKLIKSFGLENDHNHCMQEIKDLQKAFEDSIIEIENRYPCDVFEDFHTITENKNQSFRDFFEAIEKEGYILKSNDKQVAEEVDFDFLNNSYSLDAHRILFTFDLDNKGAISSFTTEANKILKNGDIYDKCQIMLDRILYCLSTINYESDIIDKKTIKNLKTRELSAEEIKFILSSYDYFKNNFTPINLDYKIDIKDLNKNVKSGQFFPEELANTIDELREYYSENIYQNCKFNTMEGSEKNNMQYFNIPNYRNHNILQPENIVCISEDNIVFNKYFIETLIHELNHAIGHHAPFDKDKYSYTKKQGISMIKNKCEKFIDNGKTLYDKNLVMLDEDINERMTKELTKLFFKNYKMDFEEFNDHVMKPKTKMETECVYSWYNIITEQFYELFHDEIKLHYVDPNYSIYFNNDLPSNQLGEKLEFFRQKYVETINPKEFYSEGVLDRKKAEKLSDLINQLDQILEKTGAVDEISSDDFNKGRGLTHFDSATRFKLMKILSEKDKLITDIIKDKEKADKYNTQEFKNKINEINEEDLSLVDALFY